MAARCFEQVFGIPSHHRLEQVRSRARAGIVRGVYWVHEEFDAQGHLVARYESYQEMARSAPRRSGWCKFDRSGHLVASGDEIPARVDGFA
jgi:hypothetical protein